MPEPTWWKEKTGSKDCSDLIDILCVACPATLPIKQTNKQINQIAFSKEQFLCLGGSGKLRIKNKEALRSLWLENWYLDFFPSLVCWGIRLNFSLQRGRVLKHRINCFTFKTIHLFCCLTQGSLCCLYWPQTSGFPCSSCLSAYTKLSNTCQCPTQWHICSKCWVVIISSWPMNTFITQRKNLVPVSSHIPLPLPPVSRNHQFVVRLFGTSYARYLI